MLYLKNLALSSAFLLSASVALAGTETYDAKTVTRPAAPELFGTGPYVALQAGVNIFQDYGRTRHAAFREGDFAIKKFSDGLGGFGGIKAGYVFGTGTFRPTVEADLFYNRFETTYRTKLNGNTIARTNDEVNSGAFLANFILRLAPPSMPRLQPYAGVGIGGYVRGESQVVVTSPAANFPTTRKGRDSGLAWQAIAGGDYYVNRNWSVFGEYKFLNYEDASPVGPQRAIRQHLAGVGLRYHF